MFMITCIIDDSFEVKSCICSALKVPETTSHCQEAEDECKVDRIQRMATELAEAYGENYPFWN